MLKRPLMFVIPVPVLLFGCPCGTLLSLATAYLVVRTCCVVRTFLTGFDLVLIRRIVFSISHFCGLPPNFLVTVPFLSVLCLPRRFFPVPCGPSLPTFKIVLFVFWRTSNPMWSLAPEQIIQQPCILAVLDNGVLGPLDSLRSASFQQPRFTWPCIYSASFKLLLLRHMTLLVFSHQRTTLFHKKLWNLPYGYCRIGSPRSCR